MGYQMVHALGIVSVTKAEGDPSDVHRLHDIEVNEVSLVDRPANKRPFLVVKRSNDMATEVRDDGKGGMTTKAGPPPMPPGGAPAGDGAAPPPGKKKPKAIGKLDVPPGFKEMMGPMLSKASEKLQELADAVGSSTPAEVGDDGEMPPVPSEFADSLNAIMGTLEKLSGMWPSAPADPDAAGDMAEGGDDASAPSEMQMRAALDNVGKVFAHPKLQKALVAKIGSKMAKDRFARLQQAAQTLTALIGELAPAPAAAAPAGAPALGKAADKDKTEKGDALLKAVEAMLGPVIKGLEGVAKTVQRQGAELDTVMKSRGIARSSTNVEESSRQQAQKSFHWPLDLNNEVSKDTVNKTESFFGDD